jgi:hypothetical protein
MSLPAKGSRHLVVDGVEYRWRIRRRPTADQRTGRTPLLLAIARADGSGASLVVRLCQSHPSNTVRLRSEAVTPGGVAAWIRTGIRQGWHPDRPGRQALLYGHDHGIEARGVRTVPRGARAPTTPALEHLGGQRLPEHRDRFELTTDHPYVEWPGGGGYQPAVIRIDDADLIELVREVERPLVQQEIERRVAAGEAREDLHDFSGQYMGMSERALRLPSRELLDEPWDTAGKGFVIPPDDPRRGKATVLGCTCGITECWFLLVRITILDEVVIWSDFEQFHRPWVYDLGPFIFDKQAYLRQLGGPEGSGSA